MNRDSATALIIGGNIGGLCAAIALSQVGIDVTVFERGDEHGFKGAGSMLWVNAMNAFEKLGLIEAVRAISAPGRHGQFFSWRGELLYQLSARGVARQSGAVAFIAPQEELRQLLLATLGPQRVRLGAECVGFSQDAAGVTAQFADGSTARGDVLIGADGLHSVIRAQLFGAARPRYAGYTAWRAVAPSKHPLPAAGIGFETWGPGQRFGVLPLSKGRVYWYALRNIPEDARDALCGCKAELLAHFCRWHEPIEAIIAATPEEAIHRMGIYDRPPLEHWGRGRVTLVGNAAHPMTPGLGQCVSQTIEDAAVLADCLRERQNIVAALRMYEEQRRERVKIIVQQARWFGGLSQLDSPLACGLRDMVMRCLPRGIQARHLARVALVGP